MMAHIGFGSEGDRLPNFTFNSEGFSSVISVAFFLNAKANESGESPTFSDGKAAIFRIGRPGSQSDALADPEAWGKTPDAPNHFILVPTETRPTFILKKNKTLPPCGNATEEALEVIVLLMVAKEEDDGLRVEKWKTTSTPNRSIEDLDPEERKAAEALIRNATN